MHHVLSRTVCALLLLLGASIAAPVACPAQPQPAEQSAAPSPPSEPQLPSDNKVAMIIYSTLIALNQANATGNYSVLRELASPSFQLVNTSGQLADAFSKLRRQNFDLTPITMMQPKLLRRPEIDDRGKLRITGFFPTQPARVNFDLMFEWIGGRWRLFGMAVDTSANGSVDGAGSARTPERPPEGQANSAGSAATPPPTPKPAPPQRSTEIGKSSLTEKSSQAERAPAASASQSEPEEKPASDPWRWFR